MTQEREKLDQLKSSVEVWFGNNAPQIKTILNISRMTQAQAYVADCSESPSSLELRFRSLSEMPISFEANPSDLALPADFSYEMRDVLFEDDTQQCRRKNHTVLVGPMDTIIDLTAGANVPPYEDTERMNPGDRIFWLQERVNSSANPDVTVLTNNNLGLALLFGTAPAIREVTGFEYVLPQDSISS